MCNDVEHNNGEDVLIARPDGIVTLLTYRTIYGHILNNFLTSILENFIFNKNQCPPHFRQSCCFCIFICSVSEAMGLNVHTSSSNMTGKGAFKSYIYEAGHVSVEVKNLCSLSFL